MLRTLRSVLWNDAERRPRAMWRFLLSAVVVLLCVVVTVLGVAALPVGQMLVGVFGSAGGSAVASALSSVTVGIPVAVGILAAGYLVDRRRVSEFGFRFDRSWWVELCLGLALGAALMTGIFLVGLLAGWFRLIGTFGGSAPAIGLVSLLAMFVAVGVYEELLTRGYILTNVAEPFGGVVSDRQAVAAAVILSSSVFGVLHLRNPNATLVSVFTISLAGVMLALGYVLTDELALPIGLHISWNFFQGGVFGFPVSGLSIGTSVFITRETGPDVVTGGQFGPEAGLLGVAAIVVGSGVIWWWAERRHDVDRALTSIATPELRWRDSTATESERRPTERVKQREQRREAREPRESQESQEPREGELGP